MKWQIWVEPNKIFTEEYPNGWDHNDVMTAASNRYGGKVTNVNPAPIGGSSDDDDDNGGGSESSWGDIGGGFVLIGGLLAIGLVITLLPYIIAFGAIGLICWGVYKFIKWIIK